MLQITNNSVKVLIWFIRFICWREETWEQGYKCHGDLKYIYIATTNQHNYNWTILCFKSMSISLSFPLLSVEWT
jgi:hypothetical protein